MAQVNTDDGLLTQGFFKAKFWGKLLKMLSKYATKDEVSAPDDAFYVNRGGTWVKAFDLQQIPIEGFPVDNTEEYQKIGEFNGYLYPYVAIGVEGTATVGLFNYDTKEYDDEITLTDGAQTTEISTRGKYEIHAKGTGIVTVVVQADAFEEGGSNA